MNTRRRQQLAVAALTLLLAAPSLAGDTSGHSSSDKKTPNGVSPLDFDLDAASLLKGLLRDLA
ncbi:MAG: hypothetical protein AAF517_22440, partial [Planctomycetota bacterium]